MIVYNRFHVNRIIGTNIMQTWTEECEEWLKANVSDRILRDLSGSQFPQTDASAKSMVELTMDYQAAYQEGLEQHYDVEMHSIHVVTFRRTISERWSFWRIVPDLTHDCYVYFIFNIQDELLAMQFKLANF